MKVSFLVEGILLLLVCTVVGTVDCKKNKIPAAVFMKLLV